MHEMENYLLYFTPFILEEDPAIRRPNMLTIQACVKLYTCI